MENERGFMAVGEVISTIATMMKELGDDKESIVGCAYSILKTGTYDVRYHDYELTMRDKYDMYFWVITWVNDRKSLKDIVYGDMRIDGVISRDTVNEADNIVTAYQIIAVILDVILSTTVSFKDYEYIVGLSLTDTTKACVMTNINANTSTEKDIRAAVDGLFNSCFDSIKETMDKYYKLREDGKGFSSSFIRNDNGWKRIAADITVLINVMNICRNVIINGGDCKND